MRRNSGVARRSCCECALLKVRFSIFSLFSCWRWEKGGGEDLSAVYE